MAREQRRLAAILAADVVGFSRLMGRDESGTLARLKAHRTERFEPALARNGGRLVKLTGDGALAEFASAVDAVSAAIEFQQAMADSNGDEPEDTRIVFRIGLHLGDLIVDGDDLYGDGVNVAARLEGEAPPGGIVVSRTVQEAVEGRLKAAMHDLGTLPLKNIERPVQAFRTQWKPEDWRAARSIPPVPPGPVVAAAGENPPLPLPDKPSIAVLPFQNMSGDPEQEYFADGMVEDIITALSRGKSLFVIARNSSFAYKGRSPDVRQVGRELGVRYVLEGSVRKAASQVRITGQLIEASTGAHIWAERFDGSLDNVFDLQDQVSSRVVGSIAPVLQQAEIERSRHKPTDSLRAYDYFLRGVHREYKQMKEETEIALSLFHKAIDLDPQFALAYAHAAYCHVRRRVFGWTSNEAEAKAAVEQLAGRALELDRNDPRVLARVGYALFYIAEQDEGASYLERAVELDPNLAQGWILSGVVRVFLGKDPSFDRFERALRLSPQDPARFGIFNGMAQGSFLIGRFDDAVSWSEKALREVPNYPPGLRMLIAAHALAGRLEEARTALANYRKIDPEARISTMRKYLVDRQSEEIEKRLRGFRLAGMEE